VVQYKNCPLGVNITIELKNMTTTSSINGFQWGVFRLTSMPVSWE